MQNLDLLEELLVGFLGHIVQCNFDKAKDLCKKEKILTNSGTFKEILNILPNIIGMEKCYSDLGFLSSSSKIAPGKKVNSLKTAYEEIKSQCEKLFNTNDKQYKTILSEVIQYTIVRCQLIDFYEHLYTYAASYKHWKIQELLENLQKNFIDSYVNSYTPKIFTSMKMLIENEIYCLYDILKAQLYLENWNLLLCTTHITSLKTRIAIWEKSLHNRETWKVSFLRSNNFPELFRWMSKFKIFLLEKFSVYFYMIIRQQTFVYDLKTLCSKHHLEFVTQFQMLSKKFGHEATSVMLVFDACGMENWHGPGYSCPLKKKTNEPRNSSYYIMLRHPEKLSEPCNLMPTIKKILVDHFSDLLFLDRVICNYLPNENGTYFVTSVEKRVSLVSYYNCKKDDKKSDIENFMLELACMMRCHRIFLSLNPSGR